MAALSDRTPFLACYRDYLTATNQDEANGLRKVAVADFAIHDDYSGKTLRGEEAFVDAQKVYDGTKNNVGHFIRFRVAKQTDQYAIVYAEETISDIVDVKDALTPEQLAKVTAKGLKTTSKSTATWGWKHTWRKTPQGWKLASLARDQRPNAERQATVGKVYYIGIPSRIDSAATENK